MPTLSHTELAPILRSKLSVELNIAKFSSFIFSPSHTAPSNAPRVKEWIMSHPESGDTIQAKILIEPIDGMTLNTFDHKTFMGLQLIWHKKIKDQDGSISVTMVELARIMGLTWGTSGIKQMTASLLRLRKIPITWTFSFFNKSSAKHIPFLEPINILAQLKLWQPNVGQKTGPAQFRFNEYIENNLKKNYVKPVYYDVIKAIRGEIALSLYSFLDIIMSQRNIWERKTTELFKNDLNMVKDYYRSERKRLLEKVVAELDGKPISTGLLILSIVRTVDDSDDKLIVRKAPFPEAMKVLKPLEDREQFFVNRILEVVEDEHSRRFYESVVRKFPESLISRVLSETKDAVIRGKIKVSKGRFFTDTLKRLSQEGKPDPVQDEESPVKTAEIEPTNHPSGPAHGAVLRPKHDAPEIEKPRVTLEEIRKFKKEMFGA